MNYLISSLFIVCVMAANAFCQDNAFPPRLAGFLTPGTHVAVRLGQNADKIQVRIFADEALAIAKDAKDLDLEQLITKYPAVAKIRDEKVQQFVAAVTRKNPGHSYGEPKVSVQPLDFNWLLGTVTYAGEDYIVVSTGDRVADRHVFATHFIQRLTWDDGVSLSLSMPRETKE